MQGIALKYFMEVAQAGSLSGASKRLHVAVSAISRQISALEHEVGAALFERAPRGMVLSEAGHLLLAHARRTQLESDEVLRQISALQGKPQDEIRVGASEGAAQGFLPVVMVDFRARFPGTRFSLHVVTPPEAARAIARGDIDVSVSFNVDPVQGVKVLHSWRAPVYAVMRADHPLAARSSLDVKDVLPYPLALTDDNSTARRLLNRTCALEGFELNAALVADYSPALHGFVRHSDAIMFAGYISVAWRLEEEGMVAIPIASPELQSRNLQIQTMEGRLLPESVIRFIDYLKAGIDKMEAGAT
ncbi:LysR family transcriptional regulator [Bordetella sp. 15P40C-2]|uniref:LysR family transcriptional regulator n=1 Tax=Bordetella sp. 15P40C-2 TaxID=2572246 RepID=UPI00132C6838|nr:LysR family transcriptional regulator [Bordetella sp. 15P40C-2]